MDYTFLVVILLVLIFALIVFLLIYIPLSSKKEKEKKLPAQASNKKQSSEQRKKATDTKFTTEQRENSCLLGPDMYVSTYMKILSQKDNDNEIEEWYSSQEMFLFQHSSNLDLLDAVATKIILLSATQPILAYMDKSDKSSRIFTCFSRYALLDYTLFSFFSFRRILCARASRTVVESLEDKFFNYLTLFFTEFFELTSDEINTIIDIRCREYDRIVLTSQQDDDTVEMLFEKLVVYVVNDLHSRAQSATVFIDAIQENFYVHLELSILTSILSSSLFPEMLSIIDGE
ncbi:MAG: hypothetical protein IJX38_01145 [Clostridia bacterium]|nr:hypothetical protein [Clostridia bacterium]